MAIKLIHPENMKFSFLLTGHDCYRIATGECPLRQKYNGKENKKAGYSGTWRYCRDLYSAMVNGTVKNSDNYSDLTIAKAGCGHYVVNDGQHRLCVAKTMKLPIYVNIVDGMVHSKCNTCYEKEKYFGIIYTVRRLIGKNKCFIC